MENLVEVVVVLVLVFVAIGLCTVAVARAVQLVEDSSPETRDEHGQAAGPSSWLG